MHFSYLLALAGIAAASPINHLRDSTSPVTPLAERQEQLSPVLIISPNKDVPKGVTGKVTVEVSKSRIRWGTAPPWDVMRRLFDECDDSGCSSEFRHKTTFVRSILSKTELELIIDSGPSRWHNNLKDPLINLLIWFLEKKDVVTIEREVPYMPTRAGRLSETQKAEFYDQYYASRRFQIEYTHTNGQVHLLQIDVRDNLEEVSADGCKDTWDILGGAAGVFTPFAGLGVALVKLFCA